MLTLVVSFYVCVAFVSGFLLGRRDAKKQVESARVVHTRDLAQAAAHFADGVALMATGKLRPEDALDAFKLWALARIHRIPKDLDVRHPDDEDGRK
jgi:hypothetical protein